MHLHRIEAISALAATLSFCGAAAAQSLDAYALSVAGAGNGSISQGCTTFGPPPELSGFFTFSGQSMPSGGISGCGYTGGVDHASASSGPLTKSKSLGPVILGNPGSSGSYHGTANSIATYGSLGASAHGNFSGGLPGSSLALFESAGAAKFSDTLTARSSQVADGSAGFVRYQFDVHGNLATPGTPAAFFFGETFMVLDIQQQSGPVHQILNAHVRRGDVGIISGNSPPAGWVTSVSSLSGGSTFFSLDLPMNWDQPWDVKVGLLAWAYGQADTDFLSTATLTGVELFDANHVQVTQFSLTSASGTNYPVPEPATWVLLLSGMAVLAFGVRRKPPVQWR